MIRSRHLLAAVATLSAVLPAPAQDGSSRPSLAGRVVRVFDFEEESTNPGVVPRDWYRAQDNPAGLRRPGFAEWNKATLTFSEDTSFSGRGAVELPTQGGSTALLLGEGVLPVFEDAEYLVSARIRTRGLKRAGACIAARLLDRTNRPIPGTESMSTPIRSDKEWTEAAVGLPAGIPGAAFLQVELLVLQPEHQPGATAGPFHVWTQDYNGSAWFDDVSITQPPRTSLSTPFAGNIIPADAKPEVRATVRDMTGEHLTARLSVLNVRGEEIAQHARSMGGAMTGSTWQPKLPEFGWYRARLDLFSEEHRVGGAYTDFVWLSPGEAEPELSLRRGGRRDTSIRTQSPDLTRFGVGIDDLRPAWAGLLPEVVRTLGVGAATVSIGDGSNASELVPFVDSLLADWRETTLCLTGVPAGLAAPAGQGVQDPWAMLVLDKTVWLPTLGDLLDRYGQRVRRWQVGSWRDNESLVWRSGVWTEAAAIRTSFSTLIAGPVLGVPTRLDIARPIPGGMSGLAMIAVADGSATPRTIEEFVSAWKDAPTNGASATDLTLMLPNTPWDRFGIAAGPREMVKRAVAFWAGISRPGGELLPGASLLIEQPWRSAGGSHANASLLPRPEFAAWRNTINMLRDRRAVGKFPVAEGVVCWILAPVAESTDRGGALIAWNETAPDQDAELVAYLGPGPIKTTDIYGNATPAAWESAANGQRQVRVPLGASPLFIEGIDIEFARFLAGFRVEPALLESNNKSHPREIVVENPWRHTITGQITILEPGGFEDGRLNRAWRVSPRVMKFSVPAGQAERVPFSVSFSPSEEVGPKDFVFDVELVADEVYQPVQIRRRLEVGLADLTLDLSYMTRGERGEDLVIEAAVSNSSGRSLTLDLTAFAPDQPRAKTTIVDLAGGNQAVRRMTFAGGMAAARGKKVVVTVRDSASEARITKSVIVQ